MANAALVFQNLGKVSVQDNGGGTGNQFPKLPESSKFRLEVTHCELTGDETSDGGVCMVIEHKVLQSSSPVLKPGDMSVTTITHCTGEYSDLKQKKVRRFIGAALGVDPADDNQPWGELAVYVTTQDAAKGKIVRAVTDPIKRSKKKNRPYTEVHFSRD